VARIGSQGCLSSDEIDEFCEDGNEKKRNQWIDLEVLSSLDLQPCDNCLQVYYC
jgi:hypothetical protein